MLHLSASCHYYLYSGATDMRKGFDGLSNEAEEKVREFLVLVQRNFLKKKMVADYASEMSISSSH